MLDSMVQKKSGQPTKGRDKKDYREFVKMRRNALISKTFSGRMEVSKY